MLSPYNFSRFMNCAREFRVLALCIYWCGDNPTAPYWNQFCRAGSGFDPAAIHHDKSHPSEVQTLSC